MQTHPGSVPGAYQIHNTYLTGGGNGRRPGSPASTCRPRSGGVDPGTFVRDIPSSVSSWLQSCLNSSKHWRHSHGSQAFCFPKTDNEAGLLTSNHLDQPPQTSLCARSTLHVLKGKWPPPASQPASSVSQAGVSHSGPHVLSRKGAARSIKGYGAKAPSL